MDGYLLNKTDNTAEILLSSSKDVKTLNIIEPTNSVGYPYFTAVENINKLFSDRNGNDYSYVDFNFYNLNKLQNLKRIIIYYEFGESNIPKSPNILWVQTKTKFMDVPILQTVNNLNVGNKILLSNDMSTTYSFFAIYLDNNGDIISLNGKRVINICSNILFTGTDIESTVLCAKNVEIEEFGSYFDEDNSGFINPISSDTLNITLKWYPLSNFKFSGEIDKYYNATLYTDTFGKEYNLTPLQFANIDTYLIYRFISDSGYAPSLKYPVRLEKDNGFIPRFKDKGTWELIGETTNNSIKVSMPENKYVGFFVGFKLK